MRLLFSVSFQRFWGRAFLLALCLSHVGCSEDDSEEVFSTSTGPRADDSPYASFALLESTQGVVTLDGASIRAGTEVSAGAMLEVAPGGHATLRFRDGGRVGLAGDARAMVNDEGEGRLLLVDGHALLHFGSGRNAAESPLRVVAPNISVEMAEPASVYLASYSGSGAWLAALNGTVIATHGEANSRRRLHPFELVGGQSLVAMGRSVELKSGPYRLVDARREAWTLQSQLEEAEAAVLQRDLDHEVSRLDTALRWLETESRRGRTLTKTHRTAVRNGDENTESSQRPLVAHSRSLYRYRRLAMARWERVRVKVLLMRHLRLSLRDDPLTPRRDRVAGLLGF